MPTPPHASPSLQVRVTYKKFGRKYTVQPGEDVPSTRASRKAASKKRRFFSRARDALAAPPTLPAENRGFAWATRGVRADAGGQ